MMQLFARFTPLIGLVLLAWSVEIASGESAVPPPAQIGNLVEELDADQYETRTAATRQLIDAGLAAVQPVVTAVLESGNLEVQIRGLEVLEGLAMSEDSELALSAWEALRQIASSRATGVSRRAEESLKSLADVRSERALHRLVELGVEVELVQLDQVIIGGQLSSEQMVIKIGEKWTGTDKDLTLFGELTNVTRVELEGEKIHDEFLRHLAGVESLQHLFARHTRISDQGISELTRLPELVTLSVRYAPLTDNSLPHLIKLRRPHLMELYGTEISPEGAVQLGKQLPHVALDVRRGAFLGVGPPQIAMPARAPGCQLGEVRENSAAEQAGLRPGDVITRYKGEAVADFEELRGMIARNRAGDIVEVEILRGGEKLNKEIKLGEWN